MSRCDCMGFAVATQSALKEVEAHAVCDRVTCLSGRRFAIGAAITRAKLASREVRNEQREKEVKLSQSPCAYADLSSGVISSIFTIFAVRPSGIRIE